MALDIYTLTRQFFDWSYENPEKISPNHCALFFFILEHCNRLGWKQKFGLPSGMAKDAIGIKSYKTYIQTLRDLVEWGFVEMLEVSKNQYSSNIVALVNNTKAHTKALDKAMLKHVSKQQPKQVQSSDQSNDTIIIHSTDIHSTEIPITITPAQPEHTDKEIGSFKKFSTWITDNAATVNKMKLPFTIDEYLKVRNEIPDNDRVKEILLKMHNWEPLLRKNKSAYLTLKNWHSRDAKETAVNKGQKSMVI